jgi:hypothetical protein
MVFLALVTVTATASAQTAPGNAWARGTTLQIFGGTATATPNTTGIFGTAMGWELTHRAEIEGAAAWLAQRNGSEAFAADLRLLINLTRPSTIVPYAGGGAGMYRGSFDTSRAALPHFYQRRVNSARMRQSVTFTDPTAVVAAGVHMYVARHLSVRPEAAVRFVTDDSRVYRVTTITFSLAYHVEEHGTK